MAFKRQLLDTADSANSQRLGPDCGTQLTADRAAYFLMDEQILRDVGDSILEH